MTTRKRVRSTNPKVSVGSGGGSAGGNGPQYNEALHIRDAFNLKPSRDEPLHIRDSFDLHPSRNEALHIRDAYSITATSTRNEALHIRDAASYTMTSAQFGASGTPDSDKSGDGWGDQASAATTHGTEVTMLCKGGSTAPGSDIRFAFLEFDLTGVTGCTATASGGSLTFVASTSNAVLATGLTVGFAVQATKWFTESTLNWTNRPTPTLTNLTPTTSVATGAAAAYTVTFTQAQLNTMIGKWLLFQFSTAGGAAPDTVTIVTREGATTANRPKLTTAYTIP